MIRFYEVKRNNRTTDSKITGQYVQKEFILDIASWISPDFYFKCSKIVNDYFIEQFKKQLEEKDKQLEEERKLREEEQQRTLEAKEESMHLKELMASDNLLTQSQIIYIATSPNYALRNRFKVGGVQSKKLLKSRL
ncbi:MAG: KilA-N domain-containing protein, partial [Cetobacterium sp.]